MTDYRVDFMTAAAREIRGVPRAVRERLLDAIEELAEEPRPRGARELAGEDAWRIRIGDYRVIYEIADGQQLSVTVVRAAHRGQVYDR